MIGREHFGEKQDLKLLSSYCRASLCLSSKRANPSEYSQILESSLPILNKNVQYMHMLCAYDAILL